ncbi:MerR family transcriptional regulator [Shimia sp. R11_0]|uniref:MerR family transcriptional regulator n=1 Tax=Shimia sp. R11_0 TaxID=2821096 RepID=UPI001ADBF13C|nr:MerR family transcriptional regulator [Shimia sp. R11_0]MBO9477627.1 MerR family transcriptional regulator [Shimia sp. R11_0]
MAKSREAFRTISEVADWLGVQTHVLRFWESKFSQVKPVKRAGGRRYYRPQDMELLGGIRKLLHEDGMPIKEAQQLLRDKGVKHVSAMSQPLDAPAPKAKDTIEAQAEPVAADEPSDIEVAAPEQSTFEAPAPEAQDPPAEDEVGSKQGATADQEHIADTVPVDEDLATEPAITPSEETLQDDASPAPDTSEPSTPQANATEVAEEQSEDLSPDLIGQQEDTPSMEQQPAPVMEDLFAAAQEPQETPPQPDTAALSPQAEPNTAAQDIPPVATEESLTAQGDAAQTEASDALTPPSETAAPQEPTAPPTESVSITEPPAPSETALQSNTETGVEPPAEPVSPTPEPTVMPEGASAQPTNASGPQAPKPSVQDLSEQEIKRDEFLMVFSAPARVADADKSRAAELLARLEALHAKAS